MQNDQSDYEFKQLAADAIESGKGWIRGLLELIAIEGQLASASLVRIVIYSGITTILGITAWLLLIAALGWLLLAWLSIPIVLLVLAGLCIVISVALVFRIKSLVGNLGFKSTREQLSSAPKVKSNRAEFSQEGL